MYPNKLSSEHMENKMVTLTSETLSFEDWIETKIQANIDKYDQHFEKPEEKLVDFKGEQQMDPNNLSSEHTENKMVTLTYENLSSEYCFETKLQAKFDKSDQHFEYPEDELIEFNWEQHMESKMSHQKTLKIK